MIIAIPVMHTDVGNLEKINFAISPIINATNGYYYLGSKGKTFEERVQILGGTC